MHKKSSDIDILYMADTATQLKDLTNIRRIDNSGII